MIQCPARGLAPSGHLLDSGCLSSPQRDSQAGLAGGGGGHGGMGGDGGRGTEKGTLSCCCLNQRLPPEWEKLEAPGSKAQARMRCHLPCPNWKPLEGILEREQGLKNASTKGDVSPL